MITQLEDMISLMKSKYYREPFTIDQLARYSFNGSDFNYAFTYRLFTLLSYLKVEEKPSLNYTPMHAHCVQVDLAIKIICGAVRLSSSPIDCDELKSETIT